MPMLLKTAALKVREAVGGLWSPVSVKASSDASAGPVIDTLGGTIAIVATGKQCSVGVSQGQYVILKDSTISGRDDGLYVATQAISANTDIDATYLTAANNGGLNDLRQIMLDMIYPVGAIYISTSGTDPSVLFGGTWEQIQNQFLLAAGSSYSAGSTGGAATHTLATENLPSHNHSVGAHSHGLNGHTHSVGAHSHGLNGHTHSIPALSGTAASNGAHTHSLSSQVIVSGSSYFASGAGAQFASVTANSNGAHTHSVTTTASTTGGNSGSTANSSAFNTGGNSGSTANSSAFNSGNTGSGTAVNHIPPYLAVYVWKRTA